MKPSELRIGSIIQCALNEELRIPDGIPRVVSAILPFGEVIVDLSPTNPQTITCPIKHCTGIPLDAEWLERCNFYKVNHVHGYSFYTFNREDKANRGLVDLDINENSTTTGGRTINHIKYLHQLQNVFYALNGIEMPITHTELTKKEI